MQLSDIINAVRTATINNINDQSILNVNGYENIALWFYIKRNNLTIMWGNVQIRDVILKMKTLLKGSRQPKNTYWIELSDFTHDGKYIVDISKSTPYLQTFDPRTYDSLNFDLELYTKDSIKNASLIIQRRMMLYSNSLSDHPIYNWRHFDDKPKKKVIFDKGYNLYSFLYNHIEYYQFEYVGLNPEVTIQNIQAVFPIQDIIVIRPEEEEFMANILMELSQDGSMSNIEDIPLRPNIFDDPDLEAPGPISFSGVFGNAPRIFNGDQPLSNEDINLIENNFSDVLNELMDTNIFLPNIVEILKKILKHDTINLGCAYLLSRLASRGHSVYWMDEERYTYIPRRYYLLDVLSINIIQYENYTWLDVKVNGRTTLLDISPHKDEESKKMANYLTNEKTPRRDIISPKGFGLIYDVNKIYRYENELLSLKSIETSEPIRIIEAHNNLYLNQTSNFMFSARMFPRINAMMGPDNKKLSLYDISPNYPLAFFTRYDRSNVITVTNYLTSKGKSEDFYDQLIETINMDIMEVFVTFSFIEEDLQIEDIPVPLYEIIERIRNLTSEDNNYILYKVLSRFIDRKHPIYWGNAFKITSCEFIKNEYSEPWCEVIITSIHHDDDIGIRIILSIQNGFFQNELIGVDDTLNMERTDGIGDFVINSYREYIYKKTKPVDIDGIPFNVCGPENFYYDSKFNPPFYSQYSLFDIYPNKMDKYYVKPMTKDDNIVERDFIKLKPSLFPPSDRQGITALKNLMIPRARSMLDWDNILSPPKKK